MSSERVSSIYGFMISSMMFLLLLCGVARCVEYTFYTFNDIVLEEESNLIDLPTYDIIGEDN